MRRLVPTLLLMLLPGACLALSLRVFHSLALTFVLYYLVSCGAVPLADLLLVRRQGWRSLPGLLRICPVRRADVLLGLGTGLAVCVLMASAFRLLEGILLGGNRILESVEAWGISRGNLALVYAVLIVFNGALEELFWRGYIHDRLSYLRHRPLAVVLPAAVFGLQHVFVLTSILPGPSAVALALAGVTAGGVLWTFLREWRGSLVPAALSHMTVTIGYMGIFTYYLFA